MIRVYMSTAGVCTALCHAYAITCALQTRFSGSGELRVRGELAAHGPEFYAVEVENLKLAHLLHEPAQNRCAKLTMLV